MRSFSLGLVLLFTLPVAAVDTPAQKATRDKLANRVSLLRAFPGVPAADVFEFLSDRYEMKIKLDADSFAAKGKKLTKETLLDIPALPGASLESFLLIAVSPNGGGFEIEKDGTLRICPSKEKYLGDRLTGPTAEFKKQVVKPVSLNREFKGVPLKDIMEFLSDRYEFTVVVDGASFANDKRKTRIQNTSVAVKPVKDQNLDAFLKSVVSQVNGEVVFRDRIVLIVEESEAKMLKKR